jgi:hypothetical protein
MWNAKKLNMRRNPVHILKGFQNVFRWRQIQEGVWDTFATFHGYFYLYLLYFLFIILYKKLLVNVKLRRALIIWTKSVLSVYFGLQFAKFRVDLYHLDKVISLIIDCYWVFLFFFYFHRVGFFLFFFIFFILALNA